MKKSILTLLFMSTLFNALHGKGSAPSSEDSALQEQLVTIIQKNCHESDIDSYVQKLNTIITRIPNTTKWKPAMKAVLSTACMLEFHPWLSGHAFNLGLYSMQNGAKAETIQSLTEILSIRTFGKEDYLQLSVLWEKMLSAKIPLHDTMSVYRTSIRRRYSIAALEGVVIVYIQNRNHNKLHGESLKTSLSVMSKYKSSRKSDQILYLALTGKTKERSRDRNLRSNTKGKQESADEIDIEAVYKKFWKNKRIKNKKTRYKLSRGTWEVNKLQRFLSKWKGTPYQNGGFTRKGTDGIGLIQQAVFNQFPNQKIPNSVNFLARIARKISSTSLSPGDILFFSGSKKVKHITQVGIYIGHGNFILVSSKRGVAESKLSDEYYKSRLVKAGRLF